ncbi:aldo/keto reductase [Psychrobacter pulmonis]|uniref:aldo/keto reductase n=1 Tax=Psychrobacter pulmonis TaxID=228654 RepID=UPI001917EFB0|nr:aldo/keto reductase [Psychrobacter pulmonis]
MKLALGTAQFGMSYGVTNTTGQVNSNEVGEILKFATEQGISVLDTAVGYGNSETVLGRYDLTRFDVISKFGILHKEGKTKSLHMQAIESLKKLNIDSFYGLLLHTEQDAVGPQAAEIFAQLDCLKSEKITKKVGVSFYSPDVAREVITNYPLDIIQIPSNLIDNRFIEAGILELAVQKKIEVHIRSIFLQGLLAVSIEQRPHSFHTYQALCLFDKEADDLHLSPVELALSHLFQHEEVAKGVIGCVSTEQIREVITAYHSMKSKIGQLNIKSLSSTDTSLINPNTW